MVPVKTTRISGTWGLWTGKGIYKVVLKGKYLSWCFTRDIFHCDLMLDIYWVQGFQYLGRQWYISTLIKTLVLEIIFYLWVEEFRIWNLRKDLFKVFQFQIQCYLTDYVSSRLVFVERISKRSCITDLNLYLYFSLAWRAQKEAVSLEHFQIWYITVFPISCVGSHVHTPAHAPLVWCV